MANFKWTDEKVKRAIEILNEFKDEELKKSFEVISEEFGISKANARVVYYSKDGSLRKSIGGSFDKNRRKFTKDEINVCLSFIKKHPDNLAHAFRLSSKETGRTFEAIAFAWYNKNGTLAEYRKKRPIFNLVSFFGFFKSNLKNNLAKGKSSL